MNFGDDVFLCLWDTISFPEVYSYRYTSSHPAQIMYPQLVSKKTIEYIHRMVYYRYATYKSVLKYFLSFDIKKLLSREVLSNDSKINKTISQELYIFPDMWSLMNTVPLSQQTAHGHIVISSQMTPKQKDIAWWKIKKWIITKVFSTHAGIFQDWNTLNKIYLHDPHKRYYANQQEPRYKVNSCVSTMKKIYQC